jgi:hypothetical protein
MLINNREKTCLCSISGLWHGKVAKNAKFLYICKSASYGKMRHKQRFPSMQKAMNRAAKDGLLQRGRPSFAEQKAMFCSANSGLLM